MAKWLALVRLLLGEVPEYAELNMQGLGAPLAPYLALAQAVRSGDLTAFQCAPPSPTGVCNAHRAGVAAPGLAAPLAPNPACVDWMLRQSRPLSRSRALLCLRTWVRKAQRDGF